MDILKWNFIMNMLILLKFYIRFFQSHWYVDYYAMQNNSMTLNLNVFMTSNFPY